MQDVVLEVTLRAFAQHPDQSIEDETVRVRDLMHLASAVSRKKNKEKLMAILFQKLKDICGPLLDSVCLSLRGVTAWRDQFDFVYMELSGGDDKGGDEARSPCLIRTSGDL